MGLSYSATIRGNLPILTKTLPNNFGIYFIKDSEANKVSYGLAHFLINFLSLLNFLSPSTSMHGTPSFLAAMQWAAVPIIAIFMLGFGAVGSLIDPTNLLSFSGS